MELETIVNLIGSMKFQNTDFDKPTASTNSNISNLGTSLSFKQNPLRILFSSTECKSFPTDINVLTKYGENQ